MHQIETMQTSKENTRAQTTDENKEEPESAQPSQNANGDNKDDKSQNNPQPNVVDENEEEKEEG